MSITFQVLRMVLLRRQAMSTGR